MHKHPWTLLHISPACWNLILSCCQSLAPRCCPQQYPFIRIAHTGCCIIPLPLYQPVHDLYLMKDNKPTLWNNNQTQVGVTTQGRACIPPPLLRQHSIPLAFTTRGPAFPPWIAYPHHTTFFFFLFFMLLCFHGLSAR